MYHILALVVISVAISLYTYFRLPREFTALEFVAQVVLVSLIAYGGYNVAKHQAMDSTEHWNGRITGKLHGTQSCCHCREVCSTCEDSKGNEYECDCHEVCDHFHDYYWSLSVSTGDTLSIDSCEPWESSVPAAWLKAKIGEPASVAHTYTNYLLADRQTLLRRSAGQGYLNKVPPFPQIYGFYKVNKVIDQGVGVPAGWENGIRELDADLGASFQVDVTVLFTTEANPEFADAVEAKWVFGPKNALIVVIGAPDRQTIAWAKVVTVSQVEALKLELRDKLPGMMVSDFQKGVPLIREAVVGKFKRTRMRNFEYLAANAVPTTGWLVVLYIGHTIFTLGLTYVFTHNKIRDTGERKK